MNNHSSSDDIGKATASATQGSGNVSQPNPQERATMITLADLEEFATDFLRQPEAVRERRIRDAIYHIHHNPSSGFHGFSENQQPILSASPEVSLQGPVFSNFNEQTGEGITSRNVDSSPFATIENNFILHKQDHKRNYWRRVVGNDDPILSANGTIVSDCGHVRQLVHRIDTSDLPTLVQNYNTRSRITQFSNYHENTLNQNWELLEKIPEHCLERWTHVGEHFTFHSRNCASSGLRPAAVKAPPLLSAIPNDTTSAGNRYSMRAPNTHTVAFTTAAQNAPSEGNRYSMRWPNTHTVPTAIAARNASAQGYNNGNPPPPLFPPNATRPLDQDGLPSLSGSSRAAGHNLDDCGKLHLH